MIKNEKKNLIKNTKERQRLIMMNWLKLKKKELMQNMRNYRANRDESVKTQENKLNSNSKQNYRGNHSESIKVHKKEINSKCMQNYRADCDEFTSMNLEVTSMN